VREWVNRYRQDGPAGLADRSSRPHRSPNGTPAALAERIGERCRQRWTGAQIATEVGVSKTTVFRIPRRLGLNRPKVLEPAAPVVRYNRQCPGELLHLDTKKLGRIGASVIASRGGAGIINRHRGNQPTPAGRPRPLRLHS
jgi:hypothetical protein